MIPSYMEILLNIQLLFPFAVLMVPFLLILENYYRFGFGGTDNTSALIFEPFFLGLVVSESNLTQFIDSKSIFAAKASSFDFILI
jgi:hypothetical protein